MLCRNVVELRSVVHIPKACVSDSSVSSRGKKDKLGSCWGILLELLQVMTCHLFVLQHLQLPSTPRARACMHACTPYLTAGWPSAAAAAAAADS
jgi:hypothetical protein